MSEPTPVAPPPSPQQQMFQMLTGMWVARSISAAARLGVADQLTEGSKSVEDLAAASRTHAPSLYRLMRALASVGVFAEEGSRRFRHTPLSELLRSGSPGSLKAVAGNIFGGSHHRSWGELEHSVRTGGIAFDHAHGMDVWKYFSQNPDEQRSFDDAMSEFTALFNPPIIKGYDFSKINLLVDIGGGHGALLASIAKANPRLRGLVYDQPHVAPGAASRFAAEGLADRCTAAGGNFFESVPSGGDAYLMKLIIHDWDEPRAAQILRNVHKASKPGTKLLVVETVVPPGAEPGLAKLGDVNMLVMTGGRERTEAEFKELFNACGFDLVKVHPAEVMSIVEGVRR